MRILVGTDGSDGAARAVELAARLTRDLNGRLTIIHVVTLNDLPLDHNNDHASIAQKRVEALGVSHVHTESLAGDVAESIIDVVRRDQIDIVILGKRGLGRLSGLLLGSVSQKVVSLAPCTVIVVP